jgi:hypothetical protein
MSLPVIPHDKANHFLYGTMISAVTITLLTLISMKYDHHISMLASGFAGAIAAIIAGVAKEFLDRRANLAAAAANQPPPHGVEMADAVYTSIGGIVTAVPIILVHGIQLLYP